MWSIDNKEHSRIDTGSIKRALVDPNEVDHACFLGQRPWVRGLRNKPGNGQGRIRRWSGVLSNARGAVHITG
eukprot:8685105-Pyramimonas_sp.AAC.1